MRRPEWPRTCSEPAWRPGSTRGCERTTSHLRPQVRRGGSRTSGPGGTTGSAASRNSRAGIAFSGGRGGRRVRHRRGRLEPHAGHQRIGDFDPGWVSVRPADRLSASTRRRRNHRHVRRGCGRHGRPGRGEPSIDGEELSRCTKSSPNALRSRLLLPRQLSTHGKREAKPRTRDSLGF